MFTDYYITSRAEKTWITKAGYPAVVVVQPMGHRCGYVQIPKDHPAAELQYEDIELDVHGGLTYGTINSEGTVFGFDCGHSCDKPDMNLMSESSKQVYEKFRKPDYLFYLDKSDFATIKSLDFCVAECEKMAEQFKQLA